MKIFRVVELPVQERRDFGPEFLGQLLVESAERVVRSHERVTCSGMYFQRAVFSHRTQFLFERRGGGR